MSRTWSEILVPVNGVYVLNATYGYFSETKVIYAIKVTDDTVISELIDNNNNDVTEDYIANPEVAVKAGTLITPLNSAKPFKGITLASGQVTLVL